MISFRRPQGHGLCLGHWLGVAAIIAALLSAPGCFATESITLRDVSFQIGQTSYRAPQVEFIGANLTEQQLGAVFDARASAPLDKRLAELSATTVNVPELVAEWSSPSGRQSVTVRDLILQNIVSGKAASASTRAVRSEGSVVAMLSIGPVAITDIDLALAARLYQRPSAI
jgi:hypothetical protein